MVQQSSNTVLEHDVHSESRRNTLRIKHDSYSSTVPERKYTLLWSAYCFKSADFSLSHGNRNGGPLVQVSSLGPNERHLSVIKVPVSEHEEP